MTKRKLLTAVCFIALCAVVGVSGYKADNRIAVQTVSSQGFVTEQKPVIVIDAGHPALKNTKNTIDFKIYKASPKKMHK